MLKRIMPYLSVVFLFAVVAVVFWSYTTQAEPVHTESQAEAAVADAQTEPAAGEAAAAEAHPEVAVGEAQAEPAAAEAHAEWTYSGNHGPAYWAELGYEECAAAHESPVNLADAQHAQLPDIRFDYYPSVLELTNNGHTIQATYLSDPASTITVGDAVYTLQQFHFHTQSEHTLDGRHAPLEIHFVHQNEAGAYAVVAVMAQFSERAQAPLVALWDKLPEEESTAQRYPEATINAADLLPAPRPVANVAAHRPYYTYAGSLTTPPCSTGVT
ncbi:MAG: carbonic anhydrase family protein, partial [Chloroflexales bacterium]|nr:carbonic anhydrase family protein [Chloroflexales bacterium]